MNEISTQEMANLALQIKQWGEELGFQQVGITDTDLADAEVHLQNWLALNFHGEMDYMQRHGVKRSRPALLHEGTSQGYFGEDGLSAGVDCRHESVTGRSGFSLYFTLCPGS